MATVKTEHVKLHAGDGTSLGAYVAMPAEDGKAPGIIVFQEAFGVNSHIQDVAGRFARLGYVAIAPEMFHRTAPGFTCKYTEFSVCMPHLQALTPEGIIADARAAFDWLQNNPRVLPNATASIGYCMGGRCSYLANSVLPLQAAVSYYGGGIATALLPRAAEMHGPILLYWGGLDKNIPIEQSYATAAALKQAGKTYVNIEFSDADHGFFCDQRANYKETAAKQSWDLTVRFLATYLGAK